MHFAVVLAKCSNKQRVRGRVRDISLKYIDQHGAAEDGREGGAGGRGVEVLNNFILKLS